MKNVLNESIERLTRLAGTDEGFYMLALHSFVEAYVGADYPPISSIEHFPELLWAYGDHLLAQGCPKDKLKTLTMISKEHDVTNRVRHAFSKRDREEALAATHNFLKFCRLCRIETASLAALQKSLEVWDERKSPIEQSAELKRMQYELFMAQRDNRKLMEQTEQWGKDRERLARLDSDTRRLTAELEAEHERVEAKAERVDELRKQVNDVAMEKRKLSEQLETYRDLDTYVEHVKRFSLYTRTRMDYERSVMKLTGEQQDALNAVRPGFDFLIKGGAGTGKTIVLLHAMQKMRKAKETELALRPGTKTLFLTYTNTLVKYDRYLAEILKESDAQDMILTADSFFLSRLRMILPRARVDYSAAGRLAAQLNTTGFLLDEVLATEVEDFLFSNNVTREEYIDQNILRRGMRQPLSRGQREAVWAIRDAMAQAMDQEGAFSKSYSRIKLIQYLEAKPEDTKLRGIDFAFIDESQDLTAADLKALKLMSSRGLIMAGDAGQTIYGIGSPYKRAGVEISGRTRILRTNFRNTRPIHELAEAYRKLSGVEGGEETTAFREGPVPELYTADTKEELAGLLVRKASLFIEKLGYDPENITVLAPTKENLAMLAGMLGRAGYACANIRDEEFSFKQEKTIRLSTLHSSKGLDFAVVLLFLPEMPVRGEYEAKEADTLARNLIYVAMTRAMDNLNLFVSEKSSDSTLIDLSGLFAKKMQVRL